MKLYQHVELLLDLIINNYFFNSRCFLLFTALNNSIIINPSKIPIINIKLPDAVSLDGSPIFRHFGCQDVLIHHKNAPEILTQFEQLIKRAKERYNRRKYIVITHYDAQVDLTILENKALNYVSDFLLIQLKQNKNSSPLDEVYQLFTHSFQGSSAIFLDEWYASNKSFLFGNYLFPNKLVNQEGRKLAIGTFHYEPYSIVDQEGESFDGTETSFILEFVRKYNLTPSFTIIGDDLWGEIYENWTGIGLLGSLVDETVDLGYAALYSWDAYYDYLDYTKPLTRTGVTAIVPAPKLANGLLTPLLSFSPSTWSLIGICFAMNTFLLFAIITRETTTASSKNYKKNFHVSLMSMTRILLLQSLTLPLNGRMKKYFFTLNLVYGLLITTSYSSGLSSIMTIPRYEDAIKTVADLARSKLNWGAPTDAWLISLKDVNQTDYTRIKKSFVVHPEDELVRISKKGHFGFSLERLPYGHYAVGDYVQRDIISNYRIMQEDIYWEQCIFMTRKNSILLPLLDDMVLRVFEAGLESYWENRVVFQYMDMSVQRGISFYTHHVDERTVVKLKWMHVEGAFTILLIGYLAAGVAFIYEILTIRNRNKSVNYKTMF